MASLDFDFEKKVFLEFYDSNLSLLKKFVSRIERTLEDLIRELPESDEFLVRGRVKDRNECLEKFIRKYKRIYEERQEPYTIQLCISDLIGFRIVCIYINQIAPIQEILISEFAMLEATNKIEQMQATENIFGYQALHMDMKLSAKQLELKEYQSFANLRFEVQIRTIIQDAWSVVDHKIKYKKEIPLLLKRKINVLSALFELADREFMTIQNEKLAFLRIEQLSNVTPVVSLPFIALSIFDFTSFLSIQFPDAKLEKSAIQRFLNELLVLDTQLQLSHLQSFFDAHFAIVQSFRFESKLNFNVFTFVRHILFVSNPEKYTLLLKEYQRIKIVQWIQNKKPLP